MITISEYAGVPVGVFGLGATGAATVEALLAGGAELHAWDDSEQGRESLRKKFPKAHVLPIAHWPWPHMACLALSPGVPLTHPAPHPVVRMAEKAGCPIMGDIELLYRACPQATFVGITGTNGKSTTTALVAHILKEAGRRVEVGGNLGTPVLTLAPLTRDGIYVLEMSSYQLDLLHSMRFRIALLLNITPDHLDRHGDMEGYIAAKMHIFERGQAGDAAIIAVDDAHTRRIAAELKREGTRQVIEVSAEREITGGVYVKKGILDNRLEEGQEWQTDISGIVSLTGQHNWQNAAAACAALWLLGVKFDAIAHGMRSFPGLAHRLEQVAEVQGVRFINDSKATNADATAKALAPYDHIYWILGGKPKEGGIENLASFFPKIAHAFLIGQAEDAFARALEGKVKYTRCGTLANAVEQAASMAFAEKEPGAVVLLSPACASFDQFKNFEERGDTFRALVKNLEVSGVGCQVSEKKNGASLIPATCDLTPVTRSDTNAA